MREVYTGQNGLIYNSKSAATRYGSRPVKNNPGKVPIEVDEKGRMKYLVEVSDDGQIYTLGDKKSRSESKYPQKRPVEVDENGYIKGIENPVFVGTNGQLYKTADQASKYGSRPSKKDINRVPVEIGEDGSIRFPKEGLSKILEGFGSVVMLVGALFFFSSNFTGNAIANLSNTTSSVLGTCLLAIGCISGFFWLKSKKK